MDYTKLNFHELRKLAKDKGIFVSKATKKAEILNELNKLEKEEQKFIQEMDNKKQQVEETTKNKETKREMIMNSHRQRRTPYIASGEIITEAKLMKEYANTYVDVTVIPNDSTESMTGYGLTSYGNSQNKFAGVFPFKKPIAMPLPAVKQLESKKIANPQLARGQHNYDPSTVSNFDSFRLGQEYNLEDKSSYISRYTFS
jgi:hypothetical protein